MIYTEHKITLDVHQTASPVVLSVKKGDTARRLLIHLAERGYPYQLSADCYAVFTALKPDGNVVFNNCTVRENEIIYDMTEQTVAAVGLMECEIIVYGAGGRQLTSASFHMRIEDTVYDTETEVESSDEFNALSELIAKVQAVTAYGAVAPAVIREVNGESISLSDASNMALQGLRIFGKSTQDGTPSPDAPVEIVSLGAPEITVTDGTGDNAQTMTLTTPGSLPGMRVATGGNYTDSDGQQWICDEVDLARGVYVQRVYRASVSDFSSGGYGEVGSHSRTALWISNTKHGSIATANGICNIMPMLGNYSADQLHFYVQNQQVWVFVPIEELEEKTTAGVLAWLTGKGAEFQFILATPIETELTAEERDAFAALHTYKPYTTIHNDVGAFMAAEYVADTKIYIGRNGGGSSGGGSAVSIGTVTLRAANWKGNAAPYSQVVAIAGVTEYSQVDLTPSVAQLAVFHEKDLAFVTENEGGIVTVYAIGDKPQNDYTMQVTITEVNV